ncbi:MAG TPA: Flp family type IVb pilin [Candidatus Cybelea sp.]|jgi:pilus assembly protein Flp/PilA|nr:Flp family type IVb pilin [Candidatus Cybelea sp.]HYM30041.1 Flp family type IVb pilin [Candidatus Cybelea sp.]
MLRIYIAATETLRRLRPDTSGVTAIEYGMIAGGIAVAILAAVITLGSDVKGTFTAVDHALNSANTN